MENSIHNVNDTYIVVKDQRESQGESEDTPMEPNLGELASHCALLFDASPLEPLSSSWKTLKRGHTTGLCASD